MWYFNVPLARSMEITLWNENPWLEDHQSNLMPSLNHARGRILSACYPKVNKVLDESTPLPLHQPAFDTLGGTFV
jgi:hypothetical protein